MYEKTEGEMIWEDSETAPFVVFDLIESSTLMNGAFQITLAAQKIVREGPGKAKKKAITTAHLRMTPAAAGELAKAIKSCFEMISDTRPVVDGERPAVN